MYVFIWSKCNLILSCCRLKDKIVTNLKRRYKHDYIDYNCVFVVLRAYSKSRTGGTNLLLVTLCHASFCRNFVVVFVLFNVFDYFGILSH